MPIYWVAPAVAGAARWTQSQQQNIAAALAAAGWFIAAGIAWWNSEGPPQLPEGVALEFCAEPQEPPEWPIFE
jgi:hypothetical protein